MVHEAGPLAQAPGFIFSTCDLSLSRPFYGPDHLDRRQQHRRLDRVPLLRPGHALPRQYLDRVGVHHDGRGDVDAALPDLDRYWLRQVREIGGDRRVERVVGKELLLVGLAAGHCFASQINAVRLSYGYQAAILLACEKEGIMAERFFLVPTSEWRSAVLGITEIPGMRKKKAPGEQRDPCANRGWLKQHATIYCDKRGWPNRSQDEDEACCVWKYGCETTVPTSTLNRLPLFPELDVGWSGEI